MRYKTAKMDALVSKSQFTAVALSGCSHAELPLVSEASVVTCNCEGAPSVWRQATISHYASFNQFHSRLYIAD